MATKELLRELFPATLILAPVGDGVFLTQVRNGVAVSLHLAHLILDISENITTKLIYVESFFLFIVLNRSNEYQNLGTPLEMQGEIRNDKNWLCI